MKKIFYHYLMPGLIFQSVVIGGGYATGRELIEYFLSLGPLSGLMGILLTTLIWSSVLALTFELARMTKSYDYRSLFQQLLGTYWWLYEVIFIILLVLILAVIGSASGILFATNFGLHEAYGTIGLLIAICILVFYGTKIIEKFLASWSFVLYAAYSALVIWGVMNFSDQIIDNFAHSTLKEGWVMGGLKYASYNIGAVPAVLFCLTHITKRKEALYAGLIGGPLAILPAVFLYIVMVGFYPTIVDAPVPTSVILDGFNVPWFSLLFQIVIFGTFIETGTAIIHMINERLATTLREYGREMPPFLRPVVAITLTIISIFLALQFGIINLIASGYGYLTFGMLFVFILPLMSVGLKKIFFSRDKDKKESI